MFFLLNFLLFPLLFATCLYLWIHQKKLYWSKRGIPSDTSFFIFSRGENIATYPQRIYTQYKNSGVRFVGSYLLLQPLALVVDFDLMRNVLFTDFEYFHDRGMYQHKRDDRLSGSVARISGEPWKRLRAKLTPTFTAAKMRYMCGTLVQVAERFSELLTEQVQQQGAVLEIRELCARYNTDVIGLVAFGIECDSLRDPDTEFRAFNPLVEMFGKTYPRIAKLIRLKVNPQKIIDFFTKIITENVEYRERHQIRRNDFLDILLELKKSQLDGDFRLTMDEIIAQSHTFFSGGSQTSSSTMAACLWELSQNQEIQERARAEVQQCLQCHDNQLTYECMKDMKYLGQVVSETLRKYPAGPVLQRVTQKTYVDPQSKKDIEKGVKVLIPVYGIHHDPEIYPKPEIFDPERFDSAAVQARHPLAYIPFGAGQHVCIAERFGRMQTTIGIAMLLRHFRFSKSLETPHSLVYDLETRVGFSAKGGVPLKVNKI